MVNFTVSFDLKSLGGELGAKNLVALRNLEKSVLSSCEPFVPFYTGKLCRSGHVSGAGTRGEVRWDASYASECYYAKRQFYKKYHPQACARWFEAAKAKDIGAWTKTARDGITGSSTRM